MDRYDFLRPYVSDFLQEEMQTDKCQMYSLTQSEIKEAEKDLGFPFPAELHNFYANVGFGWINKRVGSADGLLLAPDQVASFRLGEDIFEYDPRREDYQNPDRLVFYHESESTCIEVALDEVEDDGVCPIYYEHVKIADSLYDFVKNQYHSHKYYQHLLDQRL